MVYDHLLSKILRERGLVECYKSVSQTKWVEYISMAKKTGVQS